MTVADRPLPYSLNDLEDFQFPLFVSSNQCLLMLDASLGAPYFFDRNDDLSLQVNIKGLHVYISHNSDKILQGSILYVLYM